MQTGWFTVFAKGTEAKFRTRVPESCLPLVQFQILPKNGPESLKLLSKMALPKKWSTDCLVH